MEFLNKGGKLLVLLSEGGETKLGSNINYLLEQFDIDVNSDCVVSATYCGQMHPKEALVSDCILNREISKAMHKTSSEIKFLYPYGATLETAGRAAPLLSTGKQCFPMQRPIVAAATTKVCVGHFLFLY